MVERPLPVCPEAVLLPAAPVRGACWPSIACDQFTSEPAYWEARAREVGDSPSTLHLILPEYRLESRGAEGCAEDTRAIWRAMRRYLDEGLFEETDPGYILVERLLPDGLSRRRGVVLAVDLDAYLHAPAGEPPVRASEATVAERLPARVAVRAEAALELPHVLLLIDDARMRAVEGLAAACIGRRAPCYDLPLPAGAGRVRGYFVAADSPEATAFEAALAALPSFVHEGLFAYVGDGNHSLAAAKRIRETDLRAAAEGGRAPDPRLRFALVELINLHDPGLHFHPIHQVLYGCALAELKALALSLFADEAPHWRDYAHQDEAFARFKAAEEEARLGGPQCLLLRRGEDCALLSLERPRELLAVSSAHRLTQAAYEKGAARIDYIHGDASLAALAAEGHCALYLPALRKADFFPALERLRCLPKKTFSLGEALEKRHYVEARRIR